jgi:putative hydrolase of the HAD superfamily
MLLDLDDTLISYDGASDVAWTEVCKRFADDFPSGVGGEKLHKTLQAIREWYWSDPMRHRAGRMDLYRARRDIIATALLELDVTDPGLADIMAMSYTDIQKANIKLFPDTLDTLDHLRHRGIRMAMITNGTSQAQREKIERFGLGPYFEAILVEGEAGFGKPDPRIYELALSTLGLDSCDVWMVGDNLVWDVAGAQKLGIFAVWNDYRGHGLPEGTTIIPDRIIRSIAELCELELP